MLSMSRAARYGIYAVGLSGLERDERKRKRRLGANGEKVHYGIYAVAWRHAFRDASHGESKHFKVNCWEGKKSHFV